MGVAGVWATVGLVAAVKVLVEKEVEVPAKVVAEDTAKVVAKVVAAAAEGGMVA